MSLLNKFISNVRNKNLFKIKDRIIISVSGGVDSVVLCDLCKQAGFNFEIAHCNFQLRGEESKRDEFFVKKLAEEYSAQIFIKKFDTQKFAKEKKISIQVAARQLRYEWFDELIRSNGQQMHSTFLLTAHHANDAIETLLINFFKGTGIKGLHGISEKNDKIRRPLLFAKKDEIISFAKDNGLKFVEDSSNLSDKYTRNYFRNQLIPSIKNVFPEVEDNLLNNIERFTEAEILYQQSVDIHKRELLEYKNDEIHIPVLKLLKTKPLKTILYEIIKDYGFTALQTDETIHLLKSDTGKFISSASHKIFKNRLWLIVTPVSTIKSFNILIEKNDKEIEFESGKLLFSVFEKKDSLIPGSNSVAVLDSKDVMFPLLLRKWKQGDYFYPLGMQKKKKLSRFFVDQKLSLSEKEKIWVIESDKKIIWIINKRIDDRFKITDATKFILKIKFNAQ